MHPFEIPLFSINNDINAQNVYIMGSSHPGRKMIDSLQRTTLLVAYQLSIIVGILLLPIAMLAKRGGITLPIHRLIDRLEPAGDGVETRSYR